MEIKDALSDMGMGVSSWSGRLSPQCPSETHFFYNGPDVRWHVLHDKCGCMRRRSDEWHGTAGCSVVVFGAVGRFSVRGVQKHHNTTDMFLQKVQVDFFLIDKKVGFIAFLGILSEEQKNTTKSLHAFCKSRVGKVFTTEVTKKIK
jgi:hypothetical protein